MVHINLADCHLPAPLGAVSPAVPLAVPLHTHVPALSGNGAVKGAVCSLEASKDILYIFSRYTVDTR